MNRPLFYSLLACSILLTLPVSPSRSTHLLSSASAQGRSYDQPVLLEDLSIVGNRRILRDKVLEVIKSKPGQRYDRGQITRDFEAVLAMGFFDPLKSKLLQETGSRGQIIVFQLSEYPVISEVRYQGLKSASEDEIIARLKQQKVDLGKESPLTGEKIEAARNVIRELLREKEHPEAKVEIWVEDLSATTCALLFQIDEGPRIRK